MRSHQHCSGTATSGDHLSVSQCFWNRNAFASFQVPAIFVSSSQPVDPKVTYSMDAYEKWMSMVEIRWQSSDRTDVSEMPSSHNTALTTSAASQVSRKSTGTTSSNRKPSDHTVTKTSALSIGAGVAIGVSVLVIAICIMLASLYYFKRRKRRNETSIDPSFKDDRFTRSLSPPHSIRHELYGWHAMELEAMKSPQEMASNRRSTFR